MPPNSEYVSSHECLHKTLIHKTAYPDLKLTTSHLVLSPAFLSRNNMSATSDLLSNTSQNEPLKGIWQAVKPYTAILREVSHHSPSSPSPPSMMQKSVMESRRVACTHLTMERKYGSSKCMVCRRVPDFGWVYQCTQDQIDQDTYNDEVRTCTGAVQNDSGYSSGVQTPKVQGKTGLKPWMEQAVREGKYTQGQEATLRAQRQLVLNLITDSEKQHEAQVSSVPMSLDLVSKGIGDVPPNATPPKIPSIHKSKSRLFPFCIQRACPLCRATFKDRTWQYLEDVFSDPQSVEIDFETDLRRLSDPALVRNLGLRKPMHLSPILKTFGSSDKFSLNDLGQLVRRSSACERQADIQSSLQPAVLPTQEPDTKGFRKSVKKGFRRLLMSRRNSFYTTPAGGTTESGRTSALPSQQLNDSADFDIGLWRQLNMEILAEAAATRLPGVDGEDYLEGAVKDIDEGVEALALTEEAADLGTADILVAV